eukprot:gnl/MRDRNA2_/MRDRNA2_105221_c0_seq1.p1 gnl/MRDRNA2_/MRDRNA2_105221_c0~~gnl/MRDRNA2_/MRDRNA2_105221_c0_seq1.p1  ORF type:complete len:490 (-),score=80.16 gnl/MRDRNA2_/MRDRNA2_105221_c0_seq1:666-2135(-)
MEADSSNSLCFSHSQKMREASPAPVTIGLKQSSKGPVASSELSSLVSYDASACKQHVILQPCDMTESSLCTEVEQLTPDPCVPGLDQKVWHAAKAVSMVGLVLMVGMVSCRAADSSSADVNMKRVKSPTGWLGAIGAILVFGSTMILTRLQILKKVDETAQAGLFAVFSALGNALTNLIGCVVLRLLGILQGSAPVECFFWGFVGASDIIVIQFLACKACQVLGIAAAPAIWCGIGMSTSFAWGVLAFNEPVQSQSGSVLGLMVLAMGVAFCASAQTALPLKLAGVIRRRRWASSDELSKSSDEAPSQVEEPTQSSSLETVALLHGFGLTICVGLLDGSLMVPYKLFMVQASSIAGKSGTPSLTYTYLENFGLGLLALFPLLLALQAALWSWRHSGSLNGFTMAAKTCALPGILTGFFWAMGNMCSVHASEYLGVALGFPLTQACIIVTAIWGMALFGEMPGTASRVACATGIGTVCSGAGMLALFGRG